MGRKLKDVFLDTIQSFSMVTPKDKLLVAVSGGPDSMALLHLCTHYLQVPVGVFHLNHGFRESAEDEAVFVEKMANSWSVDSHIYRYNVVEYLERTGESSQEGARNVRYSLLQDCVSQYGYTKVVTGHHAHDQGETVLMRILRGSGVLGLAGIKPIRDQYIRPLLFSPKAEILAYCEENQIAYCQDESNFSDKYFRNKIRLDLLPYLEREYSPQIYKQLCNLAETARADDLELHQQAQALFSRLTWQEEERIYLDRRCFQKASLSMQRRLLRLCFVHGLGNAGSLDFDHIEELRKKVLAKGPFSVELPLINVTGTANTVIFGIPERNRWDARPLALPGQVTVGRFRITARIFSLRDSEIRSDNCEDFALEDLHFPLEIRPRRPGDRLQVFGQQGTKKVKDILINEKIPLHLRDELPLVCDQMGILWICGVRRSELGRISKDTREIVRLSIDDVNHCHSVNPVL